MYRWHIADPIRFTRDLRVTIQALGWLGDPRKGAEFLPLQDDIASVAYWYQTLPAAKFPPLGDRSNAGNLPHLQYRSFPAAEAYAAVDAATMVIVQFESAPAIENADAIMAVDGVDMVLIGTNDLLADYGLPGQYDHPRVHEAYTKTLAACRKHGKHLAVGGFASRADLAAKYVRMGARYVSTGTDLGFLLAACTAKAKEVQDMASQ